MQMYWLPVAFLKCHSSIPFPNRHLQCDKVDRPRCYLTLKRPRASRLLGCKQS